MLTHVGLLALATLVSVLVARQLMIASLDRRIDQELAQETRELRQLAGGIDPETGRPFGTRVRRVFEVFLERNVPSGNEALLTFVDSRPFLRSQRVVPYRLDRDRELVARWAALDRSERDSVETPAGRVDYLGVPVRTGGEARGVFVVAIFRDREVDELEGSLRALGGLGLAVLLFGAVLAWRLAEGVLRPVRAVTTTARAISDTDLGGRIPVSGDDEVAGLARTFNEMLDRLERAFVAQKRFLDDAAHELRTPITIVRGHLELMGEDAQERRETVALVTDELDRMARMVHDLLLLSKAEAPDFLQLEVVAIDELTREVYAKAQALGPQRWELERSARGSVVADRERLTQALVQLAENAARHAGDGIRVTLGSSVAAGEARFWVRDEGAGIPADEQRPIFERLARGPGARRADGTGLGLAIVRTNAEAHRGRVELDSRPGAGATFTIVIPMDQPWPGS